MDGQHRYEINLKKDDLFIELSSDDVYFISKQMDKWFKILLDDSYVPVTMPQRPEPAPQPQPEPVQYVQEPPPPPPVVEQPVYTPPPPPPVQQAPQPQPEPQLAPAAVEVFVQPPTVEQAAPAATVELPMAQPSLPQNPPPEPQGHSVVMGASAPALDETVQDDFEAVMDSLMKDLEGEEQPASPAYNQAELAYVGTNPGMYNEQMPANGAARKVDLNMIDSLAELCDRSNAASSEDYLLLSAYYLTYFEGLDKFSLKKVNSMLVKSGLTPVNHSILETTLSRGMLSMIPDLTGTAEVTEYVLTEEGQRHANSLL